MIKTLINIIGLCAVALPINSALATCPKNLDYTFKPLAEDTSINLCEQYAGKVVLVVNTASKCGYTYQYDGLETLYDRYRERGLVVLGFPSNDFGNQEPGSEKQIHAFCRSTYGVKFPMFQKTPVSKGNAHPFYENLAKASGEYPAWNFHKYLLDRDGNVIATFRSRVDPNHPQLVQAIEKLL